MFFEATGGNFSSSASGTAASGKVTFTQNPAVGNTITVNGTAVTFVASGATGAQVDIGTTLNNTLVALAAMLNASADVNITPATYLSYPTGGANELHYSWDAVGVAGNAIVVTTNVTGATVTAMAGGTASATAITGAYWVTSATGGEPAVISLGIQR